MKRTVFLVGFFLFLAAGLLQAQDDKQNILFFGDSITAGNGVDNSEAFPALVQQRIDSLGWNYNVINGGLSGETSAGGLRRIDWMLKQPVDVFILELGGNDGLRGVEVQSTKKNLQEIIDKVEAKYPEAKIILAGMQVPPNLGIEYTRNFKQMYSELAKANDLPLIPFILEGAAMNDELMQGDDIHPNAKGHKVVAENVWEVLKPILQEMSSQSKS